MKTGKLTYVSLMTAILCIAAPVSVNIGQIPVSLSTFFIYLFIYISGWRYSTVSVCVYIAIGTVGFPVFSGYTGGIAKLLGPTGGYIAGYIFIALIGGFLTEKAGRSFAATLVSYIAATAVLYIFGTAWFIVIMKTDILAALSICVFPFIIFDLIKIVLGIIVGKKARKLLKYADCEV